MGIQELIVTTVNRVVEKKWKKIKLQLPDGNLETVTKNQISGNILADLIVENDRNACLTLPADIQSDENSATDFIGMEQQH